MIIRTDLTPYVCSPGDLLRTAVARMNEFGAADPFQIVVDKSGRPVGTITDGDIRRALLREATLDDPVHACMHPSPEVGRADAPESENLNKLTSGALTFLPLIDGKGVLSAIMIRNLAASPPLSVLIMAGGEGKRLAPATRRMPKPLLEVGDKPILGHILDRLEAAGADSVHISVHYRAEQIERFIGDRSSSANIELLQESEPLGTAGAIGSLGPQTAPLLVLNGDVITNTDYAALVAFHKRHDNEATVAVARHEVEIPFGVVRHDGEGVFLGVDEKPSINNFVSAGIYYLSPEVCALVPPNQPLDMPELLNRSHAVGLRVGLFPIHEYWIDVGAPDDLDAARKDGGRRK